VSITRFRRRAEPCAIACALLMATGGTALAADPRVPQERYLASYGKPDGGSRPVPQERYYASYGHPKPLSRPDTPASSDGMPWLPIGLAVGGSVLLVATTGSRRRRAHIRRHAPIQEVQP
jgi:hypothetical protein